MKNYEAKTYYQDKRVAEEYNKQYTGSLNLSNFRAQIVGRREEDAVIEMLKEIEAGGKILDIPCGTGRFSKILLKYGMNVVGADISEAMMDYAKKNVEGLGNIEFKVADASSLPFANKEFDGVLSFRLYQRIPSEVRINMLKEIRRVSKNWAILNFGMQTPWLNLRKSIRSKFIKGRANNPNAVTFEGMKKELNEAGLKIEKVKWVSPFVASGLVVKVSIVDNNENKKAS